jgi:hypothetical protein
MYNILSIGKGSVFVMPCFVFISGTSEETSLQKKRETQDTLTPRPTKQNISLEKS